MSCQNFKIINVHQLWAFLLFFSCFLLSLFQIHYGLIFTDFRGPVFKCRPLQIDVELNPNSTVQWENLPKVPVFLL